MAVTKGLWNIGGVNIPDLGINEGLQKLTGIQIGPLNSNQYPSQSALGVNTQQPLNGQGSSVPTYTNTYGPANPSTGLIGGLGNNSAVQNYVSNPSGQGNSGGGASRLQQLQAIQSSGGLNPVQQTEFNTLQQAQDPYAGLRNDISSSWDNYLNSLGETSNYLNDQQGAQRGIADSQFQQGQNTINTQKAQSLKDIANTTRNAFQAGNNYLGSLGAGDSSAANQYSFAINQQANKQTGDVNNFVNTQLQQLQSTHDQQVNQIAQWFAGKQQELKQQIAQGGLQKGQDLANLSKGILDQAMQATNALKANTQNQYNSLLSWAANNSQNIGQLQQNIAAIPQAMGQLNLGAGGVGATPTYGGAAVNPMNKKTDIFGNPIA